MQLVDQSVEFIVQLLLLSFQVLHLLQFYLIFPFHVTDAALDIIDFVLALCKLALNFLVLLLLFNELNASFVVFNQWLLHTGVILLLDHHLTLSSRVLVVGIGEVVLKLLNDIHICVRNL